METKKTLRGKQRKNGLTREYLTVEQARTFFETNINENELNIFELASNLLTYAICMEYNDKVNDSKKFRGLVLRNVKINVKGFYGSDMGVCVEDIYGNVTTIPAWCFWRLYKIGPIYMAELFFDEDLDDYAIGFGEYFDGDGEPKEEK